MPRPLTTEERLEERLDEVGWDGLTAPEKNFHALWLFEAELSNGGLGQLFDNVRPAQRQVIPRALHAVGAFQMEVLFVAAESRRDHVLRHDLDDLEDAELDRLEHLLGDYPDDLGSLIDQYVAQHASEFLGPADELQRWHARRARGADTTPEFITDSMRHSTRATDAKMSSRACPNCDYPSPDFRATCRECGYPHGRV